MKQDFKKTADGYAYEYPRAAITTDIVVFGYDGYDLQVLLIRRGIEPFKGSWALPGGFLRMDETVGDCAFRELEEETAFSAEQIEQFGVFSSLDRDPRGRVVTIAFYALVKKDKVRGGDDADEAQWFPMSRLPRLAFDHYDILKEAERALRRDIHHKPIAFKLLTPHFSMPELQRLYEHILGRTFDRRNFQKKMIASGVLKESGKVEATGHRPSKLFSFSLKGYGKMKASDSSEF